MSTLEFILSCLWDIIWPIKGIIYMEEQLFQMIYAYLKALISINGAGIIIIIALFFAVSLVVTGTGRFPRVGRYIWMAVRIFLYALSALLLAWVMLVLGAIRGTRNDNTGEEQATVNVNTTQARTFLFTWGQNFTHTSLHFRLGRWLYRFFYNLLGRITGFRNHGRVHEILARVLALVVIFWGVWNIPGDLAH